MKLSIETRKSGVVVPLGALRTARSGGVGEYPDLAVLGELCERCGLSFVQLLPVNDTGFQSSPYSALSAFALHPLYLRPADLPEAAAFRAEAESLAARFGGRKRFPYPEILSAKLALLRRIFDASLPAIRKDPALALNMMAQLSLRLRQFAGLIEDLSLKEVPGRLAKYLLYLSDESGGGEMALDVSKGQLASLLGTIPETLSRILAKMKRQGLIGLRGAQIRIIDRPGVEQIALEGKMLS